MAQNQFSTSRPIQDVRGEWSSIKIVSIFISSVQILSIAFFLSFTVICKPNINRVDQFADVIGFTAQIPPDHSICEKTTTF
jgi:hypothetical protein